MIQHSYQDSSSKIDPEVLTGLNREYFRCQDCGWFRNLTTRPEVLCRTLPHPVYGAITVHQMAQKDVEFHRCGYSLSAILRGKHARS